MSTSSWSTGSVSVPGHSQKAPAADHAAESTYDTALPPIQSKDLSVSRRRPVRPDSSMIIGNFREMQRPGAPFHTTHDSMSNMIARGPSIHRRTESTLKTVMRKIFHRKRRSQVDELEEDPIVKPYHSPTNPSRMRHSENEGREALAPLPKGNTPIQKDIRPTLMDLNKLDPMLSHRRRATLPSLIFSEDESHDPLDKEERGDKSGPDSGAGRSLDNLRSRRALRNKRQSRSTNSLRRKANEHRMSPIQWTRKSAEITYLGSPVFGAVSDSELSARPPTRGTTASATKAPSVTESEQHTEVESIPPSVGNLVHTMQHDDNITMEQRVTTLEVKLIDLEFAIARMQDKRSGSSSEPSPRSKKSSIPDTGRLHVGKQSSGNSSPFSPTTAGSSSYASPRFPGEDRPLSTSTLRPNALHRSRTCQPPPSPNVDSEAGMSIEHYNALVTLLQKEQSARRNLEGQISTLREDIQQLQNVARDSMSLATMYPFPSADSQDVCRPELELQPTTQPTRAEKNVPFYDTSKGLSHTDVSKKNDACLRKLERRIEIAGMI